jgi:DNA polymerase-3 subunit gamma/tau
VENGVPVVMTEGTVPMAAPTAPHKKPELPKAIPEDVKEIVSNWPTIVGNTDNPMRIYLKNAKLSLGGDNKLMVVLEDGTPSDYFTEHPDNKAQLEAVIADFLGKEVEVTIQSVRSRQEFKESYVDLSQIIHMDIEVEE